MKKMLMMATTAAMIEQFNKNNILILEEMGYEVHVVGNFKDGNPISIEKIEQFKEWLTQHNGKWFHIPSTRKPTDTNNIKAYKQVVKLIKEYKYEFVHCHTPIGSVIARCAAHKTNTPIIYTAHGFHFFKGAPLLNWLIYYPVEKFLSRWTDILVTINKEDFNCANRRFHAKRTEYIPGVGIDLDKFSTGKIDREKKRRELGLQEDDVMLLSVGELIKRKNHEIVIHAIKEVRRKDIKYFICGQGILKDKLEKLIKELRLEKQVYLLGYRNDISELCQAAEIFVFPSLQEGLPVALMEAMACSLPCICSNIRGNTDLITNEQGGVLVDPYLKKEFCEAICMMSCNQQQREKMGKYNFDISHQYSIETISKQMKKIYEELAR